MSLKVMKRKAALKLLKSSPTAMDVVYLIILHIDWNIGEKFLTSILYSSPENHVLYIQTDIHKDKRTFQIIEYLRY